MPCAVKIVRAVNIKSIIAFFAAACLLTGCFKDVSTKTTFVLKPLLQELSGDQKLPLEGVKAYAFNVDTTQWTVATYADALAGIITQRADPTQKLSTPDAVAEPYEKEGTVGWLQMLLAAPTQMVVAVDPAQKLYAYTQQVMPENLPNLYVSLLFQPWKVGKVYKEGAWMFFNEFYAPPVTLKCLIAPTAQLLEEGSSTEPIAKAKAYAFSADTTAWYIASYDDALNGKITFKTDPKQTRTNPNFLAYKEESGMYGMSVTSTPLMVVVVDQDSKLYAYSKQSVVLGGEPLTLPVVFRPWKKSWIYVEAGWRVVDQQFAPKPKPKPASMPKAKR